MVSDFASVPPPNTKCLTPPMLWVRFRKLEKSIGQKIRRFNLIIIILYIALYIHDKIIPPCIAHSSNVIAMLW